MIPLSGAHCILITKEFYFFNEGIGEKGWIVDFVSASPDIKIKILIMWVGFCLLVQCKI
jgi:hypothetical protein